MSLYADVEVRFYVGKNSEVELKDQTGSYILISLRGPVYDPYMLTYATAKQVAIIQPGTLPGGVRYQGSFKTSYNERGRDVLIQNSGLWLKTTGEIFGDVWQAHQRFIDDANAGRDITYTFRER